MKKPEVCQNCKSMIKVEGVGWCKIKENFTARKETCDKFSKKKGD